MALKHLMIERPASTLQFYNDLVELRTKEHLQFIDLSELVAEKVRRSGVAHGMVSVQTRHTTTAVVVNENEPLLIQDLKGLLSRLAPREACYRHDDLELREVNIGPGERRNGHSHLQAALLSPSVCLNVLDGKIQIGRWQSIFLVELDGGQRRSLSINVMGLSRG